MCLTSGSQVKSVTWTRKEASIPAEAEYLADGTLVLPKISVKDTGTYTCHIQDEKNRVILTDTTKVIVQCKSYNYIPKVFLLRNSYWYKMLT